MIGLLLAALSGLPLQAAEKSDGRMIAGFPSAWFYYGDKPERREKINELTGKPAPKLKSDKAIADIRGKIAVVDFWATWCGPCLNSIPMNNGLEKKYAGKGVVFVSICTANGQENLKKVGKERGIEYPVALDPGNKLAKAWNVHFYPTYILVDAKGIVRAAGVAPEYVEKAVEKLLSEGASAAR